ncbi:unnamed protein product [Polarella glacialis]|uniref:Uncharacterized protein n=1 Tax=Polarella glacialis TaxID=89957 RepID=A0A813D687_POLGL|nr:unnamed protein product [Polarella glacialis]CAE8612852.1 unnamed protein product [Polarella glacialis]
MQPESDGLLGCDSEAVGNTSAASSVLQEDSSSTSFARIPLRPHHAQRLNEYVLQPESDGLLGCDSEAVGNTSAASSVLQEDSSSTSFARIPLRPHHAQRLNEYVLQPESDGLLGCDSEAVGNTSAASSVLQEDSSSTSFARIPPRPHHA